MSQIRYLVVLSITSLTISIITPVSVFAQTGGVSGDALSQQIFDAVNGSSGAASNTGGTSGGTTGATTGGTAGGTTNTSGGASTGGGDGGLLDPVETLPEIEPPPLPNERDSPFVGVTFVGEQPEGRDEFRHIGVTKDSLGIGSTGTSRGGAGPGAGRAGQGVGPGTAENGFRVIRSQSIRSRVVPRFSSRPLAPTYVSSRINQRLSSLPTTQQFAGRINVTMQGRVAVISGTAQNQQQIDRIRRQLRLEPGVNRIVNQARVAN